MEEQIGRIILKRKFSILNWRNSYRIFINEVEQGKISNDSSEEYKVPVGNVSILAKTLWCSSNTFNTSISNGETIYLTVSSGMKYYYVVVGLFSLGLFTKYFFKDVIPTSLNIVIVIAYFLALGYIIYYLTFGRKNYLKIEPDSNNIFAK